MSIKIEFNTNGVTKEMFGNSVIISKITPINGTSWGADSLTSIFAKYEDFYTKTCFIDRVLAIMPTIAAINFGAATRSTTYGPYKETHMEFIINKGSIEFLTDEELK